MLTPIKTSAATQAGTVAVTVRYTFVPNHHTLPHPFPSPQVLFTYIDDDEQQLIRHALILINQKIGGSATSASEAARNIISQMESKTSSRDDTGQSDSQERQASNSNAASVTVGDLEIALLNCIDLVDLDDSPYQANLNAQGNNGQGMLHLSASLGYYRLTAGLLARGAHPDLRDKNGMTAMHIASLRGQLQIIRKLRSAGGDPALRSLKGYTPADMATSQQVLDAIDDIDHHGRSWSTATTPVLASSRESSVMSYRESLAMRSRRQSGHFEDDLENKYIPRAHMSRPVTPIHGWARSRQNSLSREQRYLDDQDQGDLAPSLFAWRAQLSAQIQQLQQSVHRTLPNLQIPALPPIPNLPDYQTNPVVRRLSSLVPQRIATPLSDNGADPAKVADYHWWELLTGAASSPPAYEEIYPGKAQQVIENQNRSALLAAGEALVDQKCTDTFDQAESSSIMDTVKLGSTTLTRQQRERLRVAHANKVKRLRSDRNLFFIWVYNECSKILVTTD